MYLCFFAFSSLVIQILFISYETTNLDLFTWQLRAMLAMPEAFRWDNNSFIEIHDHDRYIYKDTENTFNKPQTSPPLRRVERSAAPSWEGNLQKDK